MYYTQSDLIIQKLIDDKGNLDSRQLRLIIEEDEASDYKKSMNDSVDYYNCKHNIKNRVIKYTVDGEEFIDKRAPNNKIVNPYHKLLIDQKISYILGSPVVVSSEEKSLQDAIDPYLTDKFNDMLIQWLSGSSKKGVEWLHIYANSEGELDYIIIPAEQIIPIYDSQFEKELIGIIRYYIYYYYTESGTKTLHKVEWWDKEGVTFYKEVETGVYKLDDDYEANPRPHYLEYNTNDMENVVGKSFPSIPFIPLYNNDEETNDLEPIRSLIDSLDLVISDWANLIQSYPNSIVKISGYGNPSNEGIRDAIEKLKTTGIVFVDEGGDVGHVAIEIPVASIEKFVEFSKKQIFVYGQGVDTTTEDIGSAASGVALKFLYSALELKANTSIRKITNALNKFFEFVFGYNDSKFDTNSITYTFNKSLIINEGEIITNLKNSETMLDSRTLIENHPYVEDADLVEKRLKEQQKEGFDLALKNLETSTATDMNDNMDMNNA